MSETRETTKTLTDELKLPRILLWVMILPQLLLLFLNVNAWKLVHGEMTPDQLLLAKNLACYEAILLLFAVGAWLRLRRLRRPTGLLFCAFMLLANIGYLWFFTACSLKLIPATVADWMLPGSQLLYYQYALVMPSLFYVGLRLACFPVRIKRAADLGLSLGTLIMIPAGWYVLALLLDAIWHFVDPPIYVILVLAVGSTAIMLMAFLRVLTYSYIWLTGTVHGRPILLFIAGLVAPLGGLLLNRSIPFPYDFQTQSVYILTCLNAIFLLLPVSKQKPTQQAVVWCLRSALYPFSLYFFLIFLPFLPLTLPAILAAGAGFLILAPLLLFIIHTRLLLDEGKALAVRIGRARALALFAVCFSLMPLAYTGRAVMDKHALTQAIDIAYRPDYKVGKAPVRLAALRRTLLRLHDIKEGVYLPFITDWYDHLVLDGMVLPDVKSVYLETMFFGKPLELPRRTGEIFRDVLSPAANRRRGRNRHRVQLPARNVTLGASEIKIAESNGTTTATVVLSMQNNGPAGSEYVTDLTLPDGVLVSGYWLHMGAERIPGHLFEKKAAMWVYHMIRDDVRRDPGMLVYTADHTVRLSVFPFGAGETRTTEIAFSFPTGMTPTLRIGDRDISLAGETRENAVVFQCGAENSAAWVIPSVVAGTMPFVQRQAVLHFIVDASEAAAVGMASITQSMTHLQAMLPADTPCRVTLANYEFVDLTEAPVALNDVARIITRYRNRLPLRGAFCPERAIRSALLANADLAAHDPVAILTVPVFVVLKAEGSRLLNEEDAFGPFADIAPDITAYYLVRPDGKLDAHAFRDGSITLADVFPVPAPVIILRSGNTLAICRTDDASVVHLPAGHPIERYDLATDRYVPLDKIAVLSEDSPVSQGLALMAQWEKTILQPAREAGQFKDLIAQSRRTGILIPATSYMVVENSAQWIMLERSEEKSLKADKALAFDEFVETPAPPMWLLLPLVFLLPFLRRARRLRR